MVFSDLFFIFVFLPSFVVIYLIAAWLDKKVFFRQKEGVILFDDDPHKSGYQRPGFIARNIALVIFSLLFYAWGEPVYIFLMIICVIINYLCGLSIAATSKLRKMWLVIGLILNLAILGTFKYLGFFNDLLVSVGIDFGAPKLALPIGISFYIFQSISYLVDVYRKESPVQRNFFNLLLYISMFPQLIAGPIVRYGTVAHEIKVRHISANDFMEGSYRFFIGL